MSQPYLSLEAGLHDAFWEASDGPTEIPLLADFLDRHPGPALEMGAGSGRLMFSLAQLGFDIEGVELSQDMLALGRLRAETLGIEAPIHHGDMSLWDDGRKFSTILAPSFTLQLAADPAATLRHWHSLLEPGGALYLTVFIPLAELFGDLPENEWYDDHAVTLADGREGLLRTRHRIDRERRIVTREHHYTLSGEPPLSHRSTQSIRWIEIGEMVALLADCGFRLDRISEDFDPSRTVSDPGHIDCDGILTYQAVRIDAESGISC